ncbi:MAG TPA: histidine--tRNA ligase [Bryobacteraceae bacterium]|jgi:histidyl-tRNA synthetase
MSSSSESAPTRALVEPQTLKGYRDILPDELIFQTAMIEKIRAVLERYGFVPLDTPCVEYLTTLVGTGGEEADKDLIRFKSKEGENVGLRYDLTVPFARLLAQYPEQLRLPFRRYQLAPVFRNDKPGEGRYRQFRQFDFDAAGSDTAAVDAEIVAVMADIFAAVGLANTAERKPFAIHVNNRKLLEAMLVAAGIADADLQRHALRVVDKLSKIGVSGVRLELGAGRVDVSGDTIRGVGLAAASIDKLLELIAVTGSTRAAVVETMTASLPDTDLSKAALAEMRDLDSDLTAVGVSETDAVFDPSLARGLAYYTGPIFEAYLAEAPEMGAVIGGGRYNHLVDRFLEKSIAATGASFGLDRFTAALRKLKAVDSAASLTQAMVISFPGVPASYLLKIARLLREAGVRTEVYFGDPKAKMKDQLSLANLRRVPVAVIVGPDEMTAGQASVKDLRKGLEARASVQDREAFRQAGKTAQVTVGLDALVETVRGLLG